MHTVYCCSCRNSEVVGNTDSQQATECGLRYWSNVAYDIGQMWLTILVK